MKIKHTAMYVRVSTAQQRMDSQETDLRHWQLANPEAVCKYYRDTFTGKSMDRPAWNKLIEQLRSGKLDRIVVWRLDRLGRTVLGLSKLFSELQELKVPLVSLKDSIDLSQPSGRLIGHVLASVAAYETEVRGERVKAGHDVARAKGHTWGGRKVGHKVLAPEKVETVIQLKLDGKTIAHIVRATGVSRRHVYNLLEEAKVPI